MVVILYVTAAGRGVGRAENLESRGALHTGASKKGRTGNILGEIPSQEVVYLQVHSQGKMNFPDDEPRGSAYVPR
jgi:hypothetical protein